MNREYFQFCHLHAAVVVLLGVIVLTALPQINLTDSIKQHVAQSMSLPRR